jgi:tetratricopeptide (TPR) repeat protein
MDVADANLSCATGLPGSERLDADKALAKLDSWAERIRVETRRHLYRAHDPRFAEHYQGSESRLRAEMLAQVLQQDFGARYNPQRIREPDYRNAKDLFIHGMIEDANGGTCVSMPVLYAAVGRRLGYPLKLVLGKGHVFVRWEGGGERFNIEVTGTGGTDFYPDEHYKSWPQKLIAGELATGHYLKSLGAREELAVFLAARGHCLQENGRLPEAQVAYAQAHRLDPAGARQNASLAVFVVHEFITALTTDERHAANADDLDRFFLALGGGRVVPGRLSDPPGVPGGEHVPASIPLLVGKVRTDLRHG